MVMDDLKPTGLPAAGSPAADELLVFIPLRLQLVPGGGTVEVTRPEAIVGRHSTADVRLHLPDVSRRHCRLVFTQGQWQVFDLQSTNGLFVNDEAVDQATLHPLDRLRIGSYTFEVDLPSAAITLSGSDPDSTNPLRKAS